MESKRRFPTEKSVFFEKERKMMNVIISKGDKVMPRVYRRLSLEKVFLGELCLLQTNISM